MLRSTAARAFAPREGKTTVELNPAVPGDREGSVSRFFAELHGVLTERVSLRLAERRRDLPERTDVRGGSRKPSPPGTWRAHGVPLRVSNQRALAEGIEFVLETPQGSYRFLDTFDGVVQVYRVTNEDLVLQEILSVQRTDEGYQLIRKPWTRRRSTFDYASVQALANFYLGVNRK